MAGDDKRIRERDLSGFKYLEKLLPLFERLHDVGCQRDRAGNRKLHMDQYCTLILLFLFNPCLRSLRALQQASELKKVQRKLGCPRTSLGSLSEATDIFDPGRIHEIVAELAERIEPLQSVQDPRINQVLTAVDGSLVKTLARLVKGSLTNNPGEVRLHTHFDIDRHVPARMDVTSGTNSGKADEKNVLRKHLQPDHCYVMDRWFAEFALFNEIHAIGSSYVCRIRDNTNLDAVEEERELTAAAKEADVMQDIVVRLGQSSQANKRTNHAVRVVCVRTTPHKKQGGRKGKRAGPSSDGIIRIATNLLDVPAELIAQIYKQRWTIEIFFRFFKHVLGCRHLLSTDPVGIEIQVYCAIIACLLISLWTERKPTLRTYEMICLYFQGWADEEELLAHIQKLKPQDA